MPNYSNRPPADPRGPSLPLLRTPTRGGITAIVTSDDLVGTPTHFYKGRTTPCDSPDCEACGKGYPWRWHGYVAAYLQKRRMHFLFEFTARIAEHFVAYRDTHGSTRGCLFKAHRVNSQPNARVILETQRADLTEIYIPKPPDVIQCLSVLWNLAAPDIDVDSLMKQIPRLHVNQNGEGQLLEPETPNPV